jgi:hypothetical protein
MKKERNTRDCHNDKIAKRRNEQKRKIYLDLRRNTRIRFTGYNILYVIFKCMHITLRNGCTDIIIV